MAALNVNQHVSVEQLHLLRSFSTLAFVPQRTCMGRGIDDIGTCTNQRGGLPIGDQLRAIARLRAGSPARRQQPQSIFGERKAEFRRLGGKCTFQSGGS